MANVEFVVSIIGVAKVPFYHLFRPRSHYYNFSLTIYYDLETDSYNAHTPLIVIINWIITKLTLLTSR